MSDFITGIRVLTPPRARLLRLSRPPTYISRISHWSGDFLLPSLSLSPSPSVDPLAFWKTNATNEHKLTTPGCRDRIVEKYKVLLIILQGFASKLLLNRDTRYFYFPISLHYRSNCSVIPNLSPISFTFRLLRFIVDVDLHYLSDHKNYKYTG